MKSDRRGGAFSSVIPAKAGMTRKAHHAGFTLLEAVVALFIIGIAAIAALEAVGGELRSHEKVQRTLEAESLADYQLAMTQMLFYEDFVSFPDSLARGRFPEPFDGYSWTTAVEPVVNEENLFKVDLVVTWLGGSYDLNTMIYRRPQTFAVGAGGAAAGREGGARGGGDRGGGDRGGGDRAGNRGGGDRAGRAAAPGRAAGRAGAPARGPAAGRAAGRGAATTTGIRVITKVPPDTGGTVFRP